MKKIILATTSPYRQEAFRSIGIEFEAIGSDVDEKFEGRPNSPQELVQELAKQKAEAVAKKCKEGVIIGFDSVGWFNGEILEKPKSRQEAFDRLKSLSGNKFSFHTGVCLIDKEKSIINKAVVTTEAFMRNYSDKEIEKYLNQTEKYKTHAHGFDPLENYSAVFINTISGSYNNILRGIPTEHIIEMLQEIGVEIE
ncbi:MAG: Septum formation protein Maf [uncultured bacterium]|nr:MAG: Septum formation protein Maf [uncultured bacterium]